MLMTMMYKTTPHLQYLLIVKPFYSQSHFIKPVLNLNIGKKNNITKRPNLYIKFKSTTKIRENSEITSRTIILEQ